MATVPGKSPLRSSIVTLAERERIKNKETFGTNPPVTSITESQSVSPETQTDTGPGPNDWNQTDPGFYEPVGVPAGVPGAGVGRDDTPTGTAVQKMVNAKFNNKIVSQPNALDQYASYTYSLSWYLLAPDDFKKLATTPNSKKTPAGYQLLVQSGGAPEQGRDPAFGNDYYIDNLEITTALPGGGTRSAHTATALSFTLTEPNGITLLKNLYSAVDTLYKKNGITSAKPNYTAAHYMMVIRFYGYDSNGNLALPAKGLTDPKAAIEKFYPFTLAKIDFRVASKMIEYQITGAPVPYNNQLGTNRGTIPFNFELVGHTLSDILNGNPSSTTSGTVPADDGRQTESAPVAYVDTYGYDTGASPSPFQFGA